MTDKIYGRRAVFEALRSGRRKISKIMIARGELKGSLFREIVEESERRKIPIAEYDRKRIDSAAGSEHHQGIVALASAISDEGITSLLSRARLAHQDPFLLIVDGVTDPQNLGAIIRTAEAAGVHGVILPERRGAPVDRATAKASAGAVEYCPICHVGNLGQAVLRLRDEGLRIYAADADPGAMRLYDAEMRGGLALVVGAEGRGVSHSIKERAHARVFIPMRGKIASLNVSAATAVLLFEAVRQRR